ncbi:oxaloacetate decarboxylase subunit alpha, partial [Clostridium sp. CCUG 7971]|nr:oxaloacetate decarboxylase subunit alpha [Clostridium sp. CCUG 7971]
AGELAKSDEDVLAYALFPQVALKFLEQKYNKNVKEETDTNENSIQYITVTM